MSLPGGGLPSFQPSSEPTSWPSIYPTTSYSPTSYPSHSNRPTASPTTQNTAYNGATQNNGDSGYGTVVGVVIFGLFIFTILLFACLRCVVHRLQYRRLMNLNTVSALPSHDAVEAAAQVVVIDKTPITLDASCIELVGIGEFDPNDEGSFGSDIPIYTGEAVEEEGKV